MARCCAGEPGSRERQSDIHVLCMQTCLTVDLTYPFRLACPSQRCVHGSAGLRYLLVNVVDKFRRALNHSHQTNPVKLQLQAAWQLDPHKLNDLCLPALTQICGVRR